MGKHKIKVQLSIIASALGDNVLGTTNRHILLSGQGLRQYLTKIGQPKQFLPFPAGII